MDIKEKALSARNSLKSYWKKPPEGRYMPYKEIASLSVGGIGVRFIVYCIGQMIISTGNALLANTIGIDPMPLYIIYIISIVSGFPLTALRAKMIDNTRSMKGKYRPYILTMGIPTTILGIGFIMMPYELMNQFMKCTVVLLYNIGFQFFYNFFVDAYESLINVLSPNSIERSDVLSVRSIVENISPSIANISFPLLAKLITGENTLYSLKAFRFSFPPMLVAGLLISILVYAGTEEKIVQAKTHFIQVRFSDALRAVAKNKYFWIISAAGWLGFLEGSFANILQWMYNYRGACSAAQFSLIVAISGNASFWPNLAGPLFIRKWGKKKVLIFSNLLNISFIALMLPIVKNANAPGIIWVLMGCIFINQFLTSLGYLMNPSVNADIRDYQQYISGERIDGMFAAVGLIGSVITMGTGMVLPAIYDAAGLNRATAISLGYDGNNVYDVLYDPEFFVSICSVLVVASIIGAALNVIPYFFYDLTEAKQKAMVEVMKIRAAVEDKANNALTAEKEAEIKELICKSNELYSQPPRELKALRRKVSGTEFKKCRKTNEEIFIARFIQNELMKYETDEGKEELRFAHEILSHDKHAVSAFKLPSKGDIKALPKNTELQKEHKRFMQTQRGNIICAQKTAKKYYADGIKEADTAAIQLLFSKEDEAEKRIKENAKKIKAAKETKDTTLVCKLTEMQNMLRADKTAIQKEIKAATKEYSLYHRCIKPYIDAEKLIALAEYYSEVRS